MYTYRSDHRTNCPFAQKRPAGCGHHGHPAGRRAVAGRTHVPGRIFRLCAARSVHPRKRYLLAEDIDPNRLVLLEEGHCIRSQIINLCALQQAQSTLNNISYEAGSLETLRRLVEANAGITILPELALLDLDEDQMQYVRFFKPPAPAREISLVMHRVFTKRRLVDVLKATIVHHLPERLKKDKPLTVLKDLSSYWLIGYRLLVDRLIGYWLLRNHLEMCFLWKNEYLWILPRALTYFIVILRRLYPNR